MGSVRPKEREVKPPHRGEGEGLPGNRLCCRMLQDGAAGKGRGLAAVRMGVAVEGARPPLYLSPLQSLAGALRCPNATRS